MLLRRGDGPALPVDGAREPITHTGAPKADRICLEALVGDIDESE
jgi:hypothetical protein